MPADPDPEEQVILAGAIPGRTQFEKAGLPLLPVELVQRTAFQTMTYTGVPPFKAEPGGGAAANVEALVDAVAAIVGLSISKAVAA